LENANQHLGQVMEQNQQKLMKIMAKFIDTRTTDFERTFLAECVGRKLGREENRAITRKNY